MSAREVALRILGLPDDAGPAEIDAARARLRAHVEARLARAASDGERDARRLELRDLDEAFRALAAPPHPARVAGALRLARSLAALPRRLLGFAIVASVTLALLLAYLLSGGVAFGPSVLVGGRGAGSGGGGGGDGFALEGGAGRVDTGAGDEAGPTGGAQSAGPRAQVVVRSDVEAAHLSIARPGTDGAPPEVVAEGAPDDTTYYLAPGRYALDVEHADCPDGWHVDVAVAGGEHLRFDPEVCRSTGWLAVLSDQPNDRVSIDGRAVGGSAPDARHPVTTGEHEIRVEKEGFEAWEGVVAVAPGQVTRIRPRLAASRGPEREPAKPAAEPAARAGGRPSGSEAESELKEIDRWHVEAKRWLLAVYDEDRSGALDSEAEFAAIPCDQWLGLEKSYDASGLGLPMTRFYGFDGEGWKGELLGVDSSYRDIAYERMKACGLR